MGNVLGRRFARFKPAQLLKRFCFFFSKFPLLIGQRALLILWHKDLPLKQRKRGHWLKVEHV